MIEFSIFVGEVKKSTVFANSVMEAIADFREKHGYHLKGVWAMQAVIK